MITVENKVGRLIEIRIVTPVVAAEIDALALALRKAFMGMSSKAIIAADLSRMAVLAPEVSERFVAIMKNDNPKVERSGYLLSGTAATFAMQLERMVRDAANPKRRTFRARGEVTALLGEILTPPEVAALEHFFGSADS